MVEDCGAICAALELVRSFPIRETVSRAVWLSSSFRMGFLLTNKVNAKSMLRHHMFVKWRGSWAEGGWGGSVQGSGGRVLWLKRGRGAEEARKSSVCAKMASYWQTFVFLLVFLSDLTDIYMESSVVMLQTITRTGRYQYQAKFPSWDGGGVYLQSCGRPLLQLFACNYCCPRVAPKR